jgi:hypothetical protein
VKKKLKIPKNRDTNEEGASSESSQDEKKGDYESLMLVIDKTPTPNTNPKAPTPASPGKQFINWLKCGTSGKLWLEGVEKFEEQYVSFPLNKGEGL